MKKMLLFFVMIGLSSMAAHAQFNLKQEADKLMKKTTGAGLSNEEIGNGLKEALNAGVQKGVTTLSATDGYLKSALYKILIPEDVRTITSKLKQVPGFGNVEEQLIEKMNRGAEKAATKAAPIFANAITSLTFQDAMNILMGEKNAATQYLNRTTGQPLYNEFQPVIKSSLEEVGAMKYWADCVNAYNKLPFVKKANPDLPDYVTKEALEGLFGMVAEKELEIRSNPALRTTDLLKKVFAKQDK